MKDYVLLVYVVEVSIMANKWPQLVLPRFCNTSLEVVIESEELNENGTPKTSLFWTGVCNYQDKAKRIYTSNKEYVEITGSCLIPGDIAPDMAVISSGKVKIFDMERELAQGIKARNPDGTVNYTQLHLK